MASENEKFEEIVKNGDLSDLIELAKGMAEYAEESTEESTEECCKDDCAVHNRVDHSFMDDEEKFGRIITYVGEYAVITGDNPECYNPFRVLAELMGGKKPAPIDAYETIVVHVGDGVLGDLKTDDGIALDKAIRFLQTHDSWENFESAHEAVVDGVYHGLIDVSKGIKEA